jgi:hypothetical protein
MERAEAAPGSLIKAEPSAVLTIVRGAHRMLTNQEHFLTQIS